MEEIMGTGDGVAEEGRALFEARLREIIRKKQEDLDLETKEIKSTDNLKDDIGFDSLDLFELEAEIAEALDREVDIDWVSIKTFGGLIDHLEKK